MQSMRNFVAAVLLAGFATSLAHAAPKPAAPQPAAPKPDHAAPSGPLNHWSFEGWGGSFNYETIQKGFVVYQNDCASCHGLGLVHFRDLRRLGLSAEDVAAIAGATKIPHGLDAKGKPKMVAATPNDVFHSSYPSPEAAASHFNGGMPQDLSLAARAAPGGARHIFALLTGYRPAPPNIDMMPDHYYNIAVPGRQVAMAQPLRPGSVTLADGTKPSPPQMAHDVTEFLAWAADPNLDNRKRTGYGAIFFLVFLGFLVVLLQRNTRERS